MGRDALIKLNHAHPIKELKQCVLNLKDQIKLNIVGMYQVLLLQHLAPKRNVQIL